MSRRSQVELIEAQFERVFEGDAWHGTPVLSALAEVSVRQATSRPLPDGHSIWEIVNHMTSWLTIVRERVGGADRSEITAEVDWPSPLGTSAAEWGDARERLRESYVALRDFLGQLHDDDLTAIVEGTVRAYPTYVELHGVIQHSTYHTGQIMILAKAAEAD